MLLQEEREYKNTELYINIEDNLLYQISGSHAEKYQGVDPHAWLEEHLYSHMIHEQYRVRARRMLNREFLKKSYLGGKHLFSLQCHVQEEDHLVVVMVTVYLFRKSEADPVEAHIFLSDMTQNYMDEIINKILYQKDYSALGVINQDHRVINFRSCHFAETNIPMKQNIPYGELIEQMCRTHIQEKERERFVRCTDLALLKKRLELTGQYSFIIHNANNEVERYIYYWLDKNDSRILFVIDDMTRELQIDSQTGLLNREGFKERTKHILEQNPGKRYAILYFNIMRFKAINDLFGYERGDRVLRKTVEILQNSFLKPVIIARVEADHFVLLMEAENVKLNRLEEVLHFPYEDGGRKIDIRCRCGIYYIKEETDISVSEMCDRAKLAKNYISNQYVQPYAIFDDQMKTDYEEESLVMINLDRAMEQNQFQVYFQPIYRADTGKIAASEALVRWIPEPGKMVSPDRFIPVLEKNGHITRLDSFVAETVIAFQAERYRTGKSVYPVSINLSRMDLMDKHIMDMIRKKRQQSGLPGDLLRYEVTESAYMDITSSGNEFLKEMQKEGASILLDDFGSGYSSFSTMRNYSFDIVKLDKGFVWSVGQGRKEENILITMIELAHRLDMRVVAEGVETREQLEFLQQHGCDYIQGYYFSKPLPMDKFIELLKTEEQKG